MTAYVDGELGTAELAALERHLEICPDCRCRVADELRVKELVTRNHAPSPAPAGLRARILSTIARAADEVAGPGVESPLKPLVAPFFFVAGLLGWRV